MLKIADNKKSGIISGATLLYVTLAHAKPNKYKPCPVYSMQCCIDKTAAKAWKKGFPKNLPKEYDNEEFKERFQVDPPFPEQDEQFVIQFTVESLYRSGKKKGEVLDYAARPKVAMAIDGVNTDVTMKILVANGSVGDVHFRIGTSAYGTFPYLQGVFVTDLIEYQSDNLFDSLAGSEENAKQAAASPAPAASQEAADEPEEESDDSGDDMPW